MMTPVASINAVNVHLTVVRSVLKYLINSGSARFTVLVAMVVIKPPIKSVSNSLFVDLFLIEEVSKQFTFMSYLTYVIIG